MDNDNEIMKYKEYEEKYKEMFGDDITFPKCWDLVRNLEVKIATLQMAISERKRIEELGSDEEILQVDSQLTIMNNIEKVRNEVISRAESSLSQ